MGYYTEFTITLLYSPGDTPSLDRILADTQLLKQELESLSTYRFTSNPKHLSLTSGEIKWYAYEDHCKGISTKYPSWLILVEGEGEDNGDIWKAYFKNGKVARYVPTLVFPDFNPEDLK